MTNDSFETAIGQILGYLNFSTGLEHPKFISAMNLSYNAWQVEDEQPQWKSFLKMLSERLESERQSNAALRDATQANAVIDFVREEFIPGYVEFHRSLLGHHPDDQLFTQFFVSRILQTVLHCYASHDHHLDFPTVRVTFDNYIGFRPVAVLESQKIEPYSKEWTRPIPIYIAKVGAASGSYKPIVDYAIRMISTSPSDILLAAQFDLDLLDEIAIDPRAYDFDHPANKRPNYHFGQWDPHNLDQAGYFRRLIVQQVTLDSLSKRCETEDFQQPEMIFEAGAVLAGTLLMATAICGRSPDSFDSSMTISTLLPQIAKLRDRFYEWLLSTVAGKHGDRLRMEAKEKRQPFGGARQHLNSELANLRESQLEKVRLAGIYAHMGYSEAAGELSDSVQVASARIRTKVECKLTEATKAIKSSDYEVAADNLSESFQLIEEGIACGALIDPWNILGFDAQFSLFPAMENTVFDERANYLVDLMNHYFCLYSALWSHAAARDDQKLCMRIRESYEWVADWWHKFAAHEVGNVDAANAKEMFQAAEHVAQAMNLWQKDGAAAGNVAFWAQHANLFSTPRAYELIINALFDKDDLQTSMALLMHWLSQAEAVGLESAESSFHKIADQLTFQFCQKTLDDHRMGKVDQSIANLQVIRKFIDYLEVNADTYWHVPDFELGEKKPENPDLVIEDEPDEIYGAAYESVVYRDSTDDGIDGQIFETDDGKSAILENEAQRIDERLRFHETVAQIWEMVAPVFAECCSNLDKDECSEAASCISVWAEAALTKVGELHQLLYSVESLRPATGLGDHDSMVEFDRMHVVQENLMDRVIGVTVSTRHAMRMLNASQTSIFGSMSFGPDQNENLRPDEVLMADVFAAIFKNDREKLSDQVRLLFEELKEQPLLYVPISRHGAPSKIELVKSRQLYIKKLLEILPRFGLVEQTFRLLNVARSMERSHPVGNGAVTEFDDLFEIGFRAVVDFLINTANHDDSTADQRQLLFRWLERFTESSLIVWLKHSRTLRLSILEKIHDKSPWRKLVSFIKAYGKDLFTQRFLHFSNLRGILSTGVENWLDLLIENENVDYKILNDLGDKISREDAVAHLSLILEAMLENHLEYQDYNSTTTQSDHGDMLYMLIDFLRLKIGYDRICWHLRPVFWAHENLVNAGKDQVSKRWRRSLIDRINKKAARFISLLERLQRRYAMRMPSVANRIREKFIKPMQVDRMKSLVAPAMDRDNPESSASFEMLQHDAAQLLEKPEGSGIKVPAWLAAVEDEVEEVLDDSVTSKKILDLLIKPQTLPREMVREQLNTIATMTNRKKPRDKKE